MHAAEGRSRDGSRERRKVASRWFCKRRVQRGPARLLQGRFLLFHGYLPGLKTSFSNLSTTSLFVNFRGVGWTDALGVGAKPGALASLNSAPSSGDGYTANSEHSW
ncbi:uncharacterized protein LOC125508293 [Triticum urartu]|uniref:uncharacterized protein LOC125508293 n=1 Tax=Triticum urartu TaxID=4572 RepID=UPI0020442C65|nr:uncharacterized protein LOC125508293 [Triticum urartu]